MAKLASVPMATRRMAPKSVGSSQQSKYVFGHNPRESHLSTMKGVTPPGRRKMGLSSGEAPHKTDMEHFDSKNGYPTTAGGFGRTGLTGES